MNHFLVNRCKDRHAPSIRSHANRGRLRAGALCVAVGLLAVACSSSDSASEESTSTIATSAVTTTTVTETDTETDKIVTGLVELSKANAFAGDNSEESAASAVAAFNDAGFDFSPDGLSGGLPESCTGIDSQAVSEIIGAEVEVQNMSRGLEAPRGYLTCVVIAPSQPRYVMAYIHLAPDLNGFDNWDIIGSFEDASEIPDLGDSAAWTDDEIFRGDESVASTIQILVDQGGSQSFFQANGFEPQLEVIGSWSVPKLILAMAAINASVT
jgi:hypothetical protein